MKKILKVTVLFALLGLLAFSFVTCKHSSSSSGSLDGYDEEIENPDSGEPESDGGSGGNENPEEDDDKKDEESKTGDDQDEDNKDSEREKLTYQEVVDLLSKGTSSNPVKYRQLWGDSDWGEFSFYYDGSSFYYEFDNSYENNDQEKGEVEINKGDASVTVTAKEWYSTGDDWTETTPKTSSPKHKIHKYCGFILQFYDDGSAEVYEWLVKEGFESSIPTTFPTESIGTEYGSIYNEDTEEEEWDYTADVVYDFLTEDDDYWIQ